MGIATQYEGGLKFDGNQMYITTSSGTTLLTLGNTGNATFVGTIGATNFSGSSSGTNTGDQDLSTLMVKANNLSDLTNTSTARTNLKMLDVYITTGDQTTSSSTASSITGLSFSATASKRYKISGIIHIGCGSTGGVRIQVTLPTGATVYLICTGLTSSATAVSYTHLTLPTNREV